MADRQPAASFQGSRQLDRYELIAEIARGGMGTVLLARLAGAGGFQRLFAIKLMHRYLADDPEFIEMLLDEARIAARIHHPNVVSIQEVEQSREHGYYLVMDYVEGFTLWDLSNALIDAPFRQRARIVTRVVIDALQGLEAAHTLTDDEGRPLGVVHRDVSPQNILVSSSGITRVTDFGIAKAASRMTTTRVGQVKGKLAYMAPEQARGQATDARTDVWAVAVVLWESLTTRRLFKAPNDSDTYGRVLSLPIPRLMDVMTEAPQALSDVLSRGLEREIDRRAPSARQFALALEPVARASGLLADSHEIAAWMRERFAAELATRRDAIKFAASGGVHAPERVSSLPGGLRVPQLPEKSISATISPPPRPMPADATDRDANDDVDEFDEVLDTATDAQALTLEHTHDDEDDVDDFDDQATQRMDPEKVSPGVKAAIERARALVGRAVPEPAPRAEPLRPVAAQNTPPADFARPSGDFPVGVQNAAPPPAAYAVAPTPQGWVPFGSSTAPQVPPVAPVALSAFAPPPAPGPTAMGPASYGAPAGLPVPVAPAAPAKRSGVWFWVMVITVGTVLGALIQWRMR